MKYLKSRVKVHHTYCPECLSERVDIKYERETLVKKEEWADVSFLMPKIFCLECDAITEAMEANEIIHDASCIAQGLMTPGDIRALRRSIGEGLSQEEFAKLLGTGTTTVARWEARTKFPSVSLNNFMIVVRDWPKEVMQSLSPEKIELKMTKELNDGGDRPTRFFPNLAKDTAVYDQKLHEQQNFTLRH